MGDPQTLPPVLPYATVQRRRRRFALVVIGLGVGLILLLMLLLCAKSVTTPTVSVNATVRRSPSPASVRPSPAPPVAAVPPIPSAMAPAVTDEAVKVPYGAYFLLREQKDFVVLRLEPDPQFGSEGVLYSWVHAPDGICDFSRAGLPENSGATHAAKGMGIMEAGPFTFRWSQCDDKCGWIYTPPGHPGLMIYSQVWDLAQDITTVPGEDKAQRFPVLTVPRSP